jgi:hypothetical protein
MKEIHRKTHNSKKLLLQVQLLLFSQENMVNEKHSFSWFRINTYMKFNDIVEAYIKKPSIYLPNGPHITLVQAMDILEPHFDGLYIARFTLSGEVAVVLSGRKPGLKFDEIERFLKDRVNASARALASKYMKPAELLLPLTTFLLPNNITKQNVKRIKKMVENGEEKKLSEEELNIYNKTVNGCGRIYRTKQPPDKEQNILKCPNEVVYYTRDVLKQRWPEGEAKILEHYHLQYIVDYTIGVIKKRWPEGEAKILEHGNFLDTPAVIYTEEIIKQRWPEFEAKFADDVILQGSSLYYTTQKLEIIKGYYNLFKLPVTELPGSDKLIAATLKNIKSEKPDQSVQARLIFDKLVEYGFVTVDKVMKDFGNAPDIITGLI